MNVLSFSGGRTSAYLLANYSNFDKIIFCNTGKESEGTLDFVRKCGEYFEKEIIWLEYTTENKQKFKIVDYKTASRNGEPFEQLIRKKNFLPNVKTRFCSMELKALTIKRYLKKVLRIQSKNAIMTLGIRFDEPQRYFKLKDSLKNGWEYAMPLFKDKITKEDVLNFWQKQPFDLSIHKYKGNCDLCFLKGINKKIELLSDEPIVAEWWIKMEEEIGSTFDKNFSVSEILNKSKKQLKFDFDNSIDCFCNID